MAKELSKEDVIQNKKSAIKSLNQLLESYINDPSGNHLKKANLISFWLKDYVHFISFEEQFEPTRNIAYKRGNIVKVNFGFNIGSEYGGLHYGIVLDNQNAHSSPVVTVIPLTSIKANKETHENNVDLGNELYRLLKVKYDTIYKALLDEQKEIREMLRITDSLLDFSQKSLDAAKKCEPESAEYILNLIMVKDNLNAVKKMQGTWHEREAHNREELAYLEKIGNEISRMKEGSIALVNQITTVSKIRIYDPRNLRGVLAGISLSEESMVKINQKVKELYVFQ